MIPRLRTGLLLFGAFLLRAWASDPDTGDPNKIPPLRPPRPEIPPDFWETHRGMLMAAVFLGAMALTFLIWWLRRPRPAIVVPPEVQARQSLASLRSQPESGVLLSRVSQTVRRYVSTVFEISPGELTTTDLVRGMAGRDDIGPALAARISEFLQQCDQRKFAPQISSNSPAMGAVDLAENLIESTEVRRAELRAAAADQQAPDKPNLRG